jgi:hypothetical protein
MLSLTLDSPESSVVIFPVIGVPVKLIGQYDKFNGKYLLLI